MTIKIKLSVNDALIDKPCPEILKASSATGWRPIEVDIKGLMSHVTAGRAFAPRYRDEHRKGEKFICSGFIAADFDGTVTLDDARSNAFINSHAAFIYTTASHSHEQHRFRVIFTPEITLEDAQAWSDANFALAYKLGSDLAVSDKARCFFGNRSAQVWELGHVVPSEVMDDLIKSGRELRSARSSGFAVNSARRVESFTAVRCADGSIVRLDDVPVGASVHCPYHDDRRPSGFIVPSWTRGGVGIHCRACALTYWQAEADEYDFNAFDKLVERRLAHPLKLFEPKTVLEEFFPPEPDCFVSQDRFLSTIGYMPGITLIKSPKGTGKTTVLKQLCSDIEAGRFLSSILKKEHPKTILLIGHRRALLREAAPKLGLPYYLELDEWLDRNPSSLAVCLDSLPNFTKSYVYRVDGKRPYFRQDPAFDLVIIDKSEQVFSHLIGGTITKRQGALERCYDALQFQIANAKAVIALDADLGMLTTHALRYFRPQDWQSRTRIICNKPVVPQQSQTIQVYDSEVALREELLSAIGRGERCFVTCNSRKAVKVLEKIVRKKFGSIIKMRIITSDNSRESAEIEFVKNICGEFLKIQVLICSPSLGTGIDITYPDPLGVASAGLCKIDNVFGFFYAKVNTHTDMDQQLSRVRNPGAIKVWISPARFHYSSNFDVIRDDLARARYAPGAVKGYTADGLTKYDPNHPLLMIYTHVTAAQRASKNRLIELFCELRKANGWEIERIDTRVDGNRDRSEAERLLWNEHTQGLFQAPVLNDDDYLDLCIREKDSDPLNLADRLSYERNTLERALGVDLTYDIIKLNYDGGLISRVEVLSSLIRDWHSFRSLAETVLSAQELSLARLPKLRGQILLAMIAIVAEIADADGIRRDAEVTA